MHQITRASHVTWHLAKFAYSHKASLWLIIIYILFFLIGNNIYTYLVGRWSIKSRLVWIGAGEYLINNHRKYLTQPNDAVCQLHISRHSQLQQQNTSQRDINHVRRRPRKKKTRIALFSPTIKRKATKINRPTSLDFATSTTTGKRFTNSPIFWRIAE